MSIKTHNHKSLILNPNQIPKNPPIAVKIIPENDKNPAPQRLGINPPIVEPKNIPIQIKDFEFMFARTNLIRLFFLRLFRFLCFFFASVVSFCHKSYAK